MASPRRLTSLAALSLSSRLGPAVLHRGGGPSSFVAVRGAVGRCRAVCLSAGLLLGSRSCLWRCWALCASGGLWLAAVPCAVPWAALCCLLSSWCCCRCSFFSRSAIRRRFDPRFAVSGLLMCSCLPCLLVAVAVAVACRLPAAVGAALSPALPLLRSLVFRSLSSPCCCAAGLGSSAAALGSPSCLLVRGFAALLFVLVGLRLHIALSARGLLSMLSARGAALSCLRCCSAALLLCCVSAVHAVGHGAAACPACAACWGAAGPSTCAFFRPWLAACPAACYRFTTDSGRTPSDLR